MHCDVSLAESAYAPALQHHDQDVRHEKRGAFLFFKGDLPWLQKKICFKKCLKILGR